MEHFGLARFAIWLVFLVPGSFATTNSQQGGYHLIKKYTLGGGEFGRDYFDYLTLDVSARRLYLTHNTRVNVIDADSGTVLGDISNLHYVHGVALVKELDRGFISEGGADQVTIFDLKTLQVIGQVKTGGSPDCIIYDPASRHIFTFNARSKDATVIEPANGTVVATLPIGGHPEQAVADGNGMIYDNDEDGNEVVVIDSRALTIKARWPVAPAITPTAMTMDREHRRLFVGGRNKLFAIMDADNGKVIQTLPIGGGVDTNIYEPETGLVFSSTREGTLHVFHEDSPDKFTVVETVFTQPGAKTMALDTKTHNLFLDTADFGPPPPPSNGTGPPMTVWTIVPGTFVLLVYGR